MIRYAIRSRQIVDLLGDIRRGNLILSPYFQRNLVWREGHKQDFIETILKGYPFPQIFISKGTIDVTSMISTSCVVDGQQRLSTIRDFVDGRLQVDGRRFEDLTVSEREDFLKYEVAVIDLDLRDDDPQIVEVFKRLNRTFYALSTIEKYATEYASSEFMLVAKYLCGEILKNVDTDYVEYQGSDPNINKQFIEWSRNNCVKEFQNFLLDGKIFSPYETSRMVHLMYTLNLMATYIYGFYNRNDTARNLLDEYADVFSLKDEIANDFERGARLFNKMRFNKGSMWLSKSSSFSLFIVLVKNIEKTEALGAKEIKERLTAFEASPPKDYEIAAKEGVNNRKERELRNRWINNAVLEHTNPSDRNES
jgi:hypothetical protein